MRGRPFCSVPIILALELDPTTSVCAVRVCNATELALRVVVKQDHVRTSVLPSNWFGGGAYESAKTFARPCSEVLCSSDLRSADAMLPNRTVRTLRP
ncbi:hypothetical protein V9T40_000031 [Parthenolecanium corni]|uniref:Uncharacterized protein n=1 Tax=Parthenolecanium corni TaxID=536013 RepID=A0AAN9TG54_9HEMI